MWRAGFSEWRRAGEVPELTVPAAAPPPPFQAARPHPSPPPAAATASAPATYDFPGLLQLWFGFSGRLNRGKYWLVTLVNVALIIALVAVGAATDNWMPALLVVIPFYVSAFAVAVKRLHDRNKSAWWLLLYIVVPGVLSAVGESSGEPLLQGLFVLASAGISIWAFVDLGCLRGTVGANAYGPDPLPQQAPAGSQAA